MDGAMSGILSLRFSQLASSELLGVERDHQVSVTATGPAMTARLSHNTAPCGRALPEKSVTTVAERVVDASLGALNHDAVGSAQECREREPLSRGARFKRFPEGTR